MDKRKELGKFSIKVHFPIPRVHGFIDIVHPEIDQGEQRLRPGGAGVHVDIVVGQRKGVPHLGPETLGSPGSLDRWKGLKSLR